jgi:hypothetical protein
MRSNGIWLHALLFATIAVASTSAQALGKNVVSLKMLALLLQGAPGFTTTPASPIDLGPSAVGMTTPHAAALPIQMHNPGTATLSISSFSFSSFEANFTAESLFVLGPPLTVPAGSFQPANVLFTPQGPGKRTVQFTVNDNAPGSPHIVQFTGTGVPVAANDIAVILDPGAASTVSVPAGSSTTFPIWLLSGLSPTNINVTVQCSGGPSGTTCSLDHNSMILTGDGFGPTRDKIMVTVSVPARSVLASNRFRGVWWTAAFAFGILLVWKNSGNVRRFAAIAALLVMSVVMISCGGSSSSPGVTVSNTLVITATPSPGTPHSLSVPLVVQ